VWPTGGSRAIFIFSLKPMAYFTLLQKWKFLLAIKKLTLHFWPLKKLSFPFSHLFCIPFWPLPLVLRLIVSSIRRNDQYAYSFKFILNIYTLLHSLKKQKVMATEIVMDIVYKLVTKSNGYTIRKKSRFNFFSTGGCE
jgi:hypothetical protein